MIANSAKADQGALLAKSPLPAGYNQGYGAETLQGAEAQQVVPVRVGALARRSALGSYGAGGLALGVAPAATHANYLSTCIRARRVRPASRLTAF